MCGGRSSAGRALGCGPSGRGFKPRRSPHFLIGTLAEIIKITHQKLAQFEKNKVPPSIGTLLMRHKKPCL